MDDEKYILIVEDEVLLYNNLKNILEKNNFVTSKYTKSVAKAQESIKQRQPDLALLDINLIDNRLGGIVIGKMLQKLNIPFIYVTIMDDDETFKLALATHHEFFMVKTKPNLDEKALLRTIQTALMHQKDVNGNTKYIEAMVDYAHELKNYAIGTITKLRIKLDDIVYITTDKYIDENGEQKNVKVNYIALLTVKDESYFIRETLLMQLNLLPEYFHRVNGKYAINVKSSFVKALTNDNKILVEIPKIGGSIHREYIQVTQTYINSFKRIYNKLHSNNTKL